MKRFALIAALCAGLIVLSGCGGNASNDTKAAAPAVAPTSTAAPTPATVDAYQAIGKLNGIVGEGDAMKCDPSLATVSLKPLGGREWNGTIFNIDLSPGYTSRILKVTGSPVSIKSGIVRIYKSSLIDGKEYPDPTAVDLPFNMPSKWHQGDNLRLDDGNFTIYWEISKQLKNVELCVEPKGLA